jgi:hypothetical protein
VRPQIVAIAPAHGWGDQATRVNVTYVWDVGEPAESRPPAFCRLGARVAAAAAVTGDTVVCVAPPAAAQAVAVAVSFDGAVWSAEEVRFAYRNRFSPLGILPIVALYAVGIAGIAVCIWRAARAARADPDEQQPFLATARPSEGAGVVRKKRRPRRRAAP